MDEEEFNRIWNETNRRFKLIPTTWVISKKASFTLYECEMCHALLKDLKAGKEHCGWHVRNRHMW